MPIKGAKGDEVPPPHKAMAGQVEEEEKQLLSGTLLIKKPTRYSILAAEQPDWLGMGDLHTIG